MYCIIKNADWVLVVPANQFYLDKGLPKVDDHSQLEHLISRGFSEVPSSSVWSGRANYSVIHNLIAKISPDLVLDIGAFAGIFSIVANQAAASSRILAFEPFTSNCFCSALNFHANNCNASLYPFAVSSELGMSSFGMPNNMSISGSLQSMPDESSIIVPVVTVDSLVSADTFSSLVVKIDVEGLEPEVLRGMQQILSIYLDRVSAMIIEYHPNSWQSLENKDILSSLMTSFPHKAYKSAWQFLKSVESQDRFSSQADLNKALELRQMAYCDIVLSRHEFS